MHLTPDIATTTTARPAGRAVQSRAGAPVTGSQVRRSRPSQRDLVVASLVRCPPAVSNDAPSGRR